MHLLGLVWSQQAALRIFTHYAAGGRGVRRPHARRAPDDPRGLRRARLGRRPRARPEPHLRGPRGHGSIAGRRAAAGGGCLMCGIAGILLHEPGPLGESLVKMCEAMRHRGADSTGFALYGEPDAVAADRARPASRRVARADRRRERASTPCASSAATCTTRSRPTTPSGARGPVPALRAPLHGRHQALALAIEAAAPGIEIQSVGHSLEIVKDAGGAAEVDAPPPHLEVPRQPRPRPRAARHRVDHRRRLRPPVLGRAVPRRLDRPQRPDHELLHAPPPADRHDGFRFQTGNDSELIAVYLADKMSRGQTFYEALKDSVYELDGCFAYLLSMPDVIGSAKDMFAIKSIVVANVGGDIAMATEEQAIRAVYTDELDDTQHPDPRSVFVWERSGPRPAGDRMSEVSRRTRSCSTPTTDTASTAACATWSTPARARSRSSTRAAATTSASGSTARPRSASRARSATTAAASTTAPTS